MKWDRCVRKVRKESPDVNPYAVCTASIGKEGSILKSHRRKKKRNKEMGAISYLLSEKSRKLSALNNIW